MNLREAKRRMVKRQRKYVVGYLAAGNTVFVDRGVGSIDSRWIDPMSRKRALAFLGVMPCAGCAVFELVPIAVNR